MFRNVVERSILPNDQGFRYGVLDTRENIHAWLGTRTIFNKLIFNTCGIAAFTPPFEREDVIRHGFIICFGRMLRDVAPAGATAEVLKNSRLLLTGEIITPVSQPGADLPQKEAREAYVDAVDTLRSETNVSYISRATREGFVDAGGTLEEWNQTPLELPTARKIMDYIASCQLTQSPPNPVAMLTIAFVAMSKRGTVSDEFRTKIIQGIKTDIGQTITVTPEVIHALWSYYGGFVNDLVAETIFAYWKNELPGNALRLRITLEQTLNTGLTTLTVTVRGLTDHPLFPWSRLMQLSPYGTEMAAVKHAMSVVGSNHYYGYRKDLGPVKGTLHKNLSYVAKELLVKLTARRP